MVTRTEWYERVNAAWPDQVPTPTADEAVRATRKLYRFVRKKKLSLPIEITSGNRYSYAHGGTLYVNPDHRGHGGGWKALIHDLSHTFHGWISGDKPHAKSHARLELRLIKEVIKRGWLTGNLKSEPKPEKAQQDERLTKALRIEAAIQKWETKLKRAQNALKKLNRKQAYYKRHLSALSSTVH